MEVLSSSKCTIEQGVRRFGHIIMWQLVRGVAWKQIAGVNSTKVRVTCAGSEARKDRHKTHTHENKRSGDPFKAATKREEESDATRKRGGTNERRRGGRKDGDSADDETHTGADTAAGNKTKRLCEWTGKRRAGRHTPNKRNTAGDGRQRQ
jgi:hypothetical protein